jgi:prohibitin 2
MSGKQFFESLLKQASAAGSKNSGSNPQQSLGAIGLVLGGGALLLGINASLFNVEGGHRAIIFSRISGVKETIYTEGTHFYLYPPLISKTSSPWFETPIPYDVRAKPRNVASLTGTKDLQMVNITVRVLSKPNAIRLPEIYRTLGKESECLMF